MPFFIPLLLVGRFVEALKTYREARTRRRPVEPIPQERWRATWFKRNGPPMLGGLACLALPGLAEAREPLPTIEVVQPHKKRVRLLDVRGPLQFGGRLLDALARTRLPVQLRGPGGVRRAGQGDVAAPHLRGEHRHRPLPAAARTAPTRPPRSRHRAGDLEVRDGRAGVRPRRHSRATLGPRRRAVATIGSWSDRTRRRVSVLHDRARDRADRATVVPQVHLERSASVGRRPLRSSRDRADGGTYVGGAGLDFGRTLLLPIMSALR